LLSGQHVVLRGWVLGSGQSTARTKPKRGPVRPEPAGLGRPSSLRAASWRQASGLRHGTRPTGRAGAPWPHPRILQGGWDRWVCRSTEDP